MFHDDDPTLTMTHLEALAWFAGVFGGEANIPGGAVLRFGMGWRVFMSQTVGTFDDGLMTRLVLASWRYGIHCEAKPSTPPDNMSICIWGRPDRGGRHVPRMSFFETLEAFTLYAANEFDLPERDRWANGWR